MIWKRWKQCFRVFKCNKFFFKVIGTANARYILPDYWTKGKSLSGHNGLNGHTHGLYHQKISQTDTNTIFTLSLHKALQNKRLHLYECFLSHFYQTRSHPTRSHSNHPVRVAYASTLTNSPFIITLITPRKKNSQL